MLIFPAIDLRAGQVVRLSEGDYDRMTVYGNDPCAVAREFLRKGAKCLHVVDLDGAKDGTLTNFAVIKSLAKVGLFMEVGGGARDEASIEKYVSAGVSRVIIGSAAITKPGFLADMAGKYPGKIAAGVDAKGGKIAIHGWREVTDVDAMTFMRALPDIGVDTVIYTDISRDGLLKGANLEAYQATREIGGLNVIASGGVSTEGDIAALRDMGIYAAIIGKALYAGALSLEKALTIAEGETI